MNQYQSVHSLLELPSKDLSRKDDGDFPNLGHPVASLKTEVIAMRIGEEKLVLITSHVMAKYSMATSMPNKRPAEKDQNKSSRAW